MISYMSKCVESGLLRGRPCGRTNYIRPSW